MFTVLSQSLVAVGAFREFTELHNDMIKSLLRAPLKLFCTEITKEMILNRFQNDLMLLEFLSYTGLSSFYFDSFNLIGSVFIALYYMPSSLFLLPFAIIGGSLILHFWTPNLRDKNRLNMMTITPILESVSEAIEGGETIKAFSLQKYFSDKLNYKLDNYYKSNTLFFGLYCFFINMTDLLTWTFYVFLFVCFGCFKQSFEAVTVGLLIINADKLERSFIRLINFSAQFQFYTINIERCVEYAQLEAECESGLEPLNWPSEGKIELVDFSVKYPGGSEVLKNINLTIEANDKIAIIGRSGSGKSTFCKALHRIMKISQGKILIDGINFEELSLKLVRRNICIIPQNPTLLNGTVLFNIDPVQEHSAAEIKSVFDSIEFSNLMNFEIWLNTTVSL